MVFRAGIEEATPKTLATVGAESGEIPSMYILPKPRVAFASKPFLLRMLWMFLIRSLSRRFLTLGLLRAISL